MVARHSLRFVVSCSDDLARAEDAVGTSNESLLIEANADSGSLLEIEEFRRLAAAIGAAGTDVTFASDDPLRRELARIVGIRVETPEPSMSGIRRALQSDAPTCKIEREHIAQLPGDRYEPVPTLTEALNDYTNHGSDESYASFSFVITPPVPRRADGVSGRVNDAHPHAQVRRRRSGRRVGKVAAVATLSATALVLASTLILFALIAPQASITLVPATTAINADVRYGVAGQGGDYDVAIDPEPIGATISFTATIPTTGVRTEPDGTAGGEVLLTNPLTTEVVVPAGTILTGPDGVTFSTTAEVIVPAADPFGTLTMGSAVAPITADVAGPGGNLEPHALSGQLPDGIFYSNRDATSGGTTRDINVVAEADLEALRSQAKAGLASQVADSIAAEVVQGHRMVAGSVEEGSIATSFSHEAGVDATEVTVQATQDVSALAYDPAELQEMATAELNQRLTESLPRDTVLLADSISVSQPHEIPTASGNTEYRMTASARSRAVIDQHILQALKKDIVGADETEAGLQVATLNGVAGFDIEYGPEWFPFDWPPRLESRIAIDIDDGTTTQTAAGETWP